MPPRKEQVPTVGRIVHYHGAEGGPQAALIVRVDGDRANLEVFGPFGLNMHRQFVRFAEAPTPGHWSWPPRV